MGDLKIIKINKLRKIICGGKNSGNENIDSSEAKESIFHGLNEFVSFRCNKKRIPEESFSEWKQQN